MKIKRLIRFGFVLLISVLTSACFTIEKEIFLNPDGSGQLVLHISMPDLPESSKAEAAASPKDPFAEFNKFRKDIMTELPPTVKLVEAKQVRQNGVLNFYAVIEFKDLKDTEKLLASFGKNDVEIAAGVQWTSGVEKQAGKNLYTERFYFDVSSMTEAKAGATAGAKTAMPPAKKGVATKGGSRKQNNGRTGSESPASTSGNAGVSAEVKTEVKMEGMEQLEALMLSLVRLRFVLHAPSPITESNADLVLNKRIAVWNCSLINFSKEKKPIELKATY